MSLTAPFCSSFLSSNHSHKLENLSWVSLESSHRCQPPGWSHRSEQRGGRRGSGAASGSGSVPAHLTGRATMSWAGSVSQAGARHPHPPPALPCTMDHRWPCWHCFPLLGLCVFSAWSPCLLFLTSCSSFRTRRICHPSERSSLTLRATWGAPVWYDTDPWAHRFQ